MSRITNTRRAVTLHTIRDKVQSGEPLAMITCYDGAFAKLIDQTPIDMVLVGDSLGNVVLGMENTITVTMDDMLHHSKAVARGLNVPFLVFDLPFGTYTSVEDALKNGVKALQEGGAKAVKLEGGSSVVPQIKALVANGIPVVAHLGLTPQSVHALGGYKVQGKGDQAERIFQDAKAVEDAGAFALVLEMVPQDLALRISQELTIPTIGIGAGPSCDGQVLVLHDMLGFDDHFSPKFLKKYRNFSHEIKSAVEEYVQDVKQGTYPSAEHSF